MFPPPKVQDPKEWLEVLLASLARGGLSFDSEIGLSEVEGSHEVRVRLLVPIPESAWPALRGYLEGYSAECGFTVTKIRKTNQLLRFVGSRD